MCVCNIFLFFCFSQIDLLSIFKVIQCSVCMRLIWISYLLNCFVWFFHVAKLRHDVAVFMASPLRWFQSNQEQLVVVPLDHQTLPIFLIWFQDASCFNPYDRPKIIPSMHARRFGWNVFHCKCRQHNGSCTRPADLVNSSQNHHMFGIGSWTIHFSSMPFYIRNMFKGRNWTKKTPALDAAGPQVPGSLLLCDSPVANLWVLPAGSFHQLHPWFFCGIGYDSYMFINCLRTELYTVNDFTRGIVCVQKKWRNPHMC